MTNESKVYISIFFLSLNLFAQPGFDVYKHREERFEALTEKLKEDTNNYELIWERISLTNFHYTYFDMYKKSGNIKEELIYFKNTNELLDNLNTLIKNNVVIDNHNIAEYKLLRGKLYYFSGEKNKALDDYLSALSYNPSFYTPDLKDNIYIAIAAYYYNLEENLSEENARQALKYVFMADPKGCNTNMTPDCYEREKFEILKFLKEEKRLINYYKELILADYNSFQETNRGGYVTTSDISNKNKYYFRTLNRINDLAEYYNEIKNYEKSKYLTKKLIKYLPPDTYGKPYKIFPKENLQGIADKEYIKRYRNLNFEEKFQPLSWDYQDISGLIESIKLYK